MTQATLAQTIGTDGPETVPQFTSIDTIAEWLEWNAATIEDPDTDTSYFEASGDDDDDEYRGSGRVALLGIGRGFLSTLEDPDTDTSYVVAEGDDDDWADYGPIEIRLVLEGLYDRSPSGCNCGGGCIYCS